MKLGETFFGGSESRFFFAESEADLIGTVAGVVVKAGTGDTSDSDFLD